MIATPPLIPRSEWNALSLAIARGDTRQVQNLVEEHFINVNAFLDSSNWMPLLMDALLSNGYETRRTACPSFVTCWIRALTPVFAAAADTTASTSRSNRTNT